MNMWNPAIETMSRDEMAALQLERLQWSVKHAYDNVPMYREKMQKAGVKPEDIRTLSDIQYIPLTSKQDLREQYPFKLVAVPMKDIVRIHASSGTTGQPITGCYTKEDLDMWSECLAR
ncbi:MAG: phenylacetate--CoA ligase, partial [Clostridiales bacterium]|nr:phenylacetate--CoA ligase [Clostridiales bacterium]